MWATGAGSVLLAYVAMLCGGDFAGHLATASLLSAPAGLLIAKVMVPETETPETAIPTAGPPVVMAMPERLLAWTEAIAAGTETGRGPTSPQPATMGPLLGAVAAIAS